MTGALKRSCSGVAPGAEPDSDNKYKYKERDEGTHTVREGRKYKLSDDVLVPTIVVSPPSWTLACSIVGKGTNKKLVFIGAKRNDCEEIHKKCAYAEKNAETDEDKGDIELRYVGQGWEGIVLIPPL